MDRFAGLPSRLIHSTAVIARLDRAVQHSARPAMSPRRRGVLDHPPSRMMTAAAVAGRPGLGRVGHRAGHGVAKKSALAGRLLAACNLASERVTLDLGEDVVDASAGVVHLIERLYRREPCCAAPVGFLVFALLRALRGFLFLLLCHGHVRVSRRLIRSIASAARAASPPLLSSLGRARAQACASVLTVMMPLPSGILFATARSISARADSIDTISKWMVSPLITHPSAISPS